MGRELKPRILKYEIKDGDAGRTIKEFLMQRVGFSWRQLSRFKYRKDGLLLNGEKRYVNALLEAGDVLQIRLTQGGEPVEEHPHDALIRSKGSLAKAEEAEFEREIQTGYLPARDGRLQKIWVRPAAWLSERFPLRILYEDEDILAADKPSGVVCHPSPGHFDDTLSNQVAEHLGRVGQELDVRVTGRLDRDTSGIVVFALNTETAAQLIRQRQAQMMDKIYIARVEGHFSGHSHARGGSGENRKDDAAVPDHDWFSSRHDGMAGTIDLPLRRESGDSFRMVVAADGKKARTHYRILGELPDGTSLAACRIEQGRTHQIRVHMMSIGHPIVGDMLYGTGQAFHDPHNSRESFSLCAGTLGHGVPMMLHAWRSKMVQPFTGEEILLEAPLPDWAMEEEIFIRCIDDIFTLRGNKSITNLQKNGLPGTRGV